MTSNREPDISFHEYERVGGLRGAINKDAETVFGLFPDERLAIEKAFQRITEKGDGEKPVRKPEEISVLASVANLDLAGMSMIVDAFAERDLLVKRKVPEGIQVDLPHECLAWKWERLKDWIDREATLAKSLQFMSESAKKEQRLTGSALAEARQLREQGRLQGLWATRYISEAELLAVRFWLNESESWEREEQRRLDRERLRAKRNFWISLGATTVMAGLTILAVYLAFRSSEVGKMALARQLAAQSERVRKESSYGDAAAALLAAESMQRVPLLENDTALRESTVLLPKQLAGFWSEFGVKDVALSRDGRYLATIPVAGSGGFEDQPPLRVLDVATKKEMWHFRKEESFLGPDWSLVALSEDGAQAATASDYGEVCVYAPPRSLPSCGSHRRVSPYYSQIIDLAFSPDGKYLASAATDSVTAGGSVQLWTNNAAPVWFGKESDVVRTLAFDSTGTLIAVATGTNSVTIPVRETTTGKEVFHVTSQDSVQKMAFSPDDRYLVTASSDGKVTVHDLAKRTASYSLTSTGSVVALSFTISGLRYVTRVKDNVLQIFESPSDQPPATLTTDDKLPSVAISSDGRYLALGSGGYARVFETAPQKQTLQLKTTENTIHAALSSSGQYLATLRTNNTSKILTVFRTETGAKKWELIEPKVIGPVLFSPDEQLLAVGSSSEKLQMFESLTGRTIEGFTVKPDLSPLAFSADGRLLFTGSNYDVKVFDTLLGSEVEQLSCGGTVAKMAVSPDGKYVAVGTGNTVHLCNRTGETELWSSTEGGGLSALAFSPDSRFLATGSVDTTLRIFKAKTGEEISRRSLGGTVTAVSFPRDSPYLVTASRSPDGTFTIKKELYRSEDLIADACSRVTRNLSLDEWNSYVGKEVPYHRTCSKLP